MVGLFLGGCHKNKPGKYDIDPEIEPFLNFFLEEAQKRGRTFNLHVDGLIMKFSHLEGGQIGLCHHTVPLLIEFDSIYWKTIQGKKNEYNLKANIVFHELGHGLLKRGHDNSVLPSGDWKTIMCGGEKIDSRNWNVNFYGFREEYYINELFNPETPVPDWALLHPDFKDIKYRTVFEDKFLNNANKWAVKKTPLYKSSIRNKEYQLEALTGKAILSLTKLGIDVKHDFLFEVKLQMKKTENPSAKVGIVFGNNENKNTNYFLIDNKKRFYIGNSQYYGWFAECPSDYIKPLAFNLLSIRKVKNMLYFYINGKFVYQNEITNPEGTSFGFQISGDSFMTVDEVKISMPDNPQKSSYFEQTIYEDSIVEGKPGRMYADSLSISLPPLP